MGEISRSVAEIFAEGNKQIAELNEKAARSLLSGLYWPNQKQFPYRQSGRAC